MARLLFLELESRASVRGLVSKIYDATGGRQLGYRNHDLQPTFEWFDWNFYGVISSTYGRGVWRNYDAYGRLEYLRAGLGNNLNEAGETKFTYDAATGRVSKIAAVLAGTTDREFQYGYHAGSNQVDTVTGVSPNLSFQRSISRQDWREVIDQVETTANNTSQAKFLYNHDWVGQFSDRTLTGALATTLGYNSGLKDTYLYTARSEVDQAAAPNLADSSAITDRQRDWTYEGGRTVSFFYPCSESTWLKDPRLMAARTADRTEGRPLPCDQSRG